MPRLLIMYDPHDHIHPTHYETKKVLELSEAYLDIAEGLEDKDIYNIARKLAEMLLEQL